MRLISWPHPEDLRSSVKVSMFQSGKWQVFRVESPTILDNQIEEYTLSVRRLIDSGCRHLAISLGSSSYPYSKLLGFVVSTLRYARTAECRIVVVQPNKEFRELILSTNIDRMVTVIDTEESLRRDCG
jgi:hypothetical protein